MLSPLLFKDVVFKCIKYKCKLYYVEIVDDICRGKLIKIKSRTWDNKQNIKSVQCIPTRQQKQHINSNFYFTEKGKKEKFNIKNYSDQKKAAITLIK